MQHVFNTIPKISEPCQRAERPGVRRRGGSSCWGQWAAPPWGRAAASAEYRQAASTTHNHYTSFTAWTILTSWQQNRNQKRKIKMQPFLVRTNQKVAKMFVLWQAHGHGLTAMTGTKSEKIFPKNTTCVVVPDMKPAFHVNPDQDTAPDPDSDLGFWWPKV